MECPQAPLTHAGMHCRAVDTPGARARNEAVRSSRYLGRALWRQLTEYHRRSRPGGKELEQFRRAFTTPRSGPNTDATIRYRARKSDCGACVLKQRCTPKEPGRKVTRSVDEASRDVARALSQTQQYAISCKLRKKVEMSFAHLKHIHGLGRLRLRGPCGAHDDFILAATAQNLKQLAKLAPSTIQVRTAV